MSSECSRFFPTSSTATVLSVATSKISLARASPENRLAIDRRHQGKGYGRFLLPDALFRSVRSEIASFAVIVDAKDENARRFYERESFLPFPDRPMKLFRPMAEIAKLFE